MRKTAFLLILPLDRWRPSARPVLAAQEPTATVVLTVDEAIAMALRQNPFHLASQEKIAQARAGVRQAVSGFLPTLNAQGTDTLDEKLFVLEFPSMVPGQPPTADVHRLHQGLPDGLLVRPAPLRRRAADGRLQAGQLRAQGQPANPSACPSRRPSSRPSGPSTATSWPRNSPRSPTKAWPWPKSSWNNVKNLYDVGMASKFDLLRSEVQVANLKPPGHPGPQRRRRGRARPEDGLRPRPRHAPSRSRASSSRRRSIPRPEDVVAEALAQRPELRQLDYQRLMAERDRSRWPAAPSCRPWPSAAQYNIWSDALNLRKGTWQNYYTISLSLIAPHLQRLRVAWPGSASPRPPSARSNGPARA
ncbi:MAG: hypothetical protein MZV63_64865 [Marinilabiliales bacterium]|nr:hypothetical protein [Marinilabiliales bacterium]